MRESIIKTSNGVFLVPHAHYMDPRIKWLSESLAKDHKLVMIDINASLNTDIVIQPMEKNIQHITVTKSYAQKIDLFPNDSSLFQKWYKIFELDKETPELLSISSSPDFFLLINYFLCVSASLLKVCGHIKNIDFVVAADLDTLFAGALIAQRNAVPLIYDAHEFWPHSNPAFDPREVQFFLNFEKDLLSLVDFPITVTPQLAQVMEAEYNVSFSVIPNAVPLELYLEGNIRNIPENSGQCRFIFQGIYARGRGLVQLIQNWQYLTNGEQLFLRGPKNAYSEFLETLAREYNILNKTVFFLEPVSEQELVDAASDFDVGIIPYDPSTNLNNKYCCPNKLSQYMAAGLTIISNSLPFVEEKLSDARAGFSVDFNDRDAFLTLVRKIAKNDELRKECAVNSRRYFQSNFNWEIVSFSFLNHLKSDLQTRFTYYKEIDVEIEHVEIEHVEIEHVEIKALSKKKNFLKRVLASLIRKIINLMNDVCFSLEKLIGAK